MDEYVEAIDELVEVAKVKGKIPKSTFEKISKEFDLDARILSNKFKLFKGTDWFDYRITRLNASAELKAVKAMAESRILKDPGFYKEFFKPSCGVHSKSHEGETYVYVGFRIGCAQGKRKFEGELHEVIIVKTKKTIFVDWEYLYAKSPKLVDKIYSASEK